MHFLKGHNWGPDFFFLFQLSVKLLGVDDPDQVIQIGMDRLLERTGASVVGFMWLNEQGELVPKMVIPDTESEKLVLDDDLTRRVVKKRQAIRIEHGTEDGPDSFADSICVPLIRDEEVIGAIHLYRQKKSFHDSHFQLAVAMANIMVRSLVRANPLARATRSIFC